MNWWRRLFGQKAPEKRTVAPPASRPTPSPVTTSRRPDPSARPKPIVEEDPISDIAMSVALLSVLDTPSVDPGSGFDSGSVDSGASSGFDGFGGGESGGAGADGSF